MLSAVKHMQDPREAEALLNVFCHKKEPHECLTSTTPTRTTTSKNNCSGCYCYINKQDRTQAEQQVRKLKLGVEKDSRTLVPPEMKPAVVVCKWGTDQSYYALDYYRCNGGIDMRQGDHPNQPCVPHLCTQLSGGKLYFPNAPTLVPFWCRPFLGRKGTRVFRAMFRAMRKSAEAECETPLYYFPLWEHLTVSSRHIGGILQPCRTLDVYHTKFAAPALTAVLKDTLHALALLEQDRPMPQYWNIIDPNLCVSDQKLMYNDNSCPPAERRLGRDCITMSVICILKSCVCFGSVSILLNPNSVQTRFCLHFITDNCYLFFFIVLFRHYGAAPNSYAKQWVATDVLVTEEVAPKMDVLVALQWSVRQTKGTTITHLPRHLCQTIFTYFSMDQDDGCVARVGRCHIVSKIHHLKPTAHAPFYLGCEKILTAALPMLSKLRRPALLLPGCLQVVVKSQRMILEEHEHYSGVWHVDGKHEAVVAVVLYYYDVQNIVGGALEFIEQEAPEFNVHGRGDLFWKHEGSMDAARAKKIVQNMGRAKINIEAGRLVVFSNYQVLHRVLRMETKKKKGHGGYRDFIGFFIIDQRHPLQSSANRPGHYKAPIPRNDAAATKKDKRKRGRIREALLAEQLAPAGKFGLDGTNIYSTGNGSAAVLGWSTSNLSNKIAVDNNLDEEERKGFAHLDAVNKKPPLLRGVSWAGEEEGALYNEDSKWVEISYKRPEKTENGGGEQKKNGGGKQKNDGAGGEQKNDGAGGERKSKNKSVVWGKEYYNTLTGEMRSVENETGDAPQWSPWAEGVREFQHRDWVDE